jgi:adenylyltransferase/sulfurtransferase
VFEQPPAPGELATCDTAGVLGPATAVVGSLQAAAAIRMLASPGDARHDRLVTLDAWTTRLRASDIADLRRDDCPCCGQRRWEYLARGSRGATTLCGRSSVQVRGGAAVSLAALAERLTAAGDVQVNEHLLRFSPREDPALQVTLFPDGRAIVHGTTDPARARTLYARFVGN